MRFGTCNYESFSATFLPVECVLLRPAAGLIARATVALACLRSNQSFVLLVRFTIRMVNYCLANRDLIVCSAVFGIPPTMMTFSEVLKMSSGGDHGHCLCLRLFLWPTLSDAKALVLGYFVASLMGCRFSSSSFS